ncbi:MAG TPA: cupin domain-containing protein [Thermomicrobiales bacterium]|nr:cupin domain-containing protein [Thermomicrobiales bacterium]
MALDFHFGEVVDLAAEIARFAPGDTVAGRRAETLIKEDRLRVVLVTMQAGKQLDEHTAPGAITIQTLSGRMIVSAGAQTWELGAGALIALDAGVRHAVRAAEAGAFLLTIAWPRDKS